MMPHAVGSPQIAARLPFDVWLAISHFLCIKDIESLRACSRSLCVFLSERSVWHMALLDILAAKPLPYLRNELSHLTALELRKTCVRAAMVEQGFAHGRLTLRPITAVKGDFTQVRLLPGATRYIAATTRGSLEVHHVGGERADASTPAPEHAPIQIDLRVSPTNIKHAAIMHILHWAQDLEYGGSTDVEVRVYELRGDYGLSLLRTHRPSSPRNIVSFGVQSTDSGLVFMYLRGRQEQGYTAELHFVSSSGSVYTLVARLRGWMMASYLHNLLPLSGSIALLAPNRLLLATSEGTYLYDIPSSPPNEVLELNPIWSSCSQLLARAPVIGPSVVSDSDRSRIHCALWTGKDIICLDFRLAETAEHEPCHTLYEVHPHSNASSIFLGFNTSIQVLRNDSKAVVASMVSLALVQNCEQGLMRLGRSSTGIEQAKIELEPAEAGCVGDLSFDEMTGRLSVLDPSAGLVRMYELSF